MKHFYLSLVGALLLLISSDASAQSSCELTNWILQQKPNSTRTPELVPAQVDTDVVLNGATHKIYLPEGFTFSTYAPISQARRLTVSPDGVLYVTSGTGRIYALPDHNHDGVPDSVILVAANLANPDGLGFVDGTLYATDQSRLLKLNDANHDRVAESNKVIANFPAGGHISRTLVVDTINKKFFVQVGSAGNTNDANDTNRAIVRWMNYDGTENQVYSFGLRNAVGMDLDPRTNALWVNVNGMDNIAGPKHEDTPNEGIYLLCPGTHYGWPYAYGFRMRNPSMPIDTSVIESYSGPVAEIEAHSAPLAMHFYRGAVLPAKYHNACFVTCHGSWNRTVPAPSRIMVMWADSDGRNAKVQDFLTGLQPDSNYNHRWSRPVSIVEGSDSALFVSDDNAGMVYRIKWTGPTQTNLFINNFPLVGKSFNYTSRIPITWVSNNIDSVDIYSRKNPSAPWHFEARTAGTSYSWIPSLISPVAQIKLVSKDGKVESILGGTFAITGPGNGDPDFEVSDFDFGQRIVGDKIIYQKKVNIHSLYQAGSINVFFDSVDDPAHFFWDLANPPSFTLAPGQTTSVSFGFQADSTKVYSTLAHFSSPDVTNGKRTGTLRGEGVIPKGVRSQALHDAGFKLKRIQPNPISSLASIDMEFHNSGHVSMKLFDELGREQMTIMDHDVNPGDLNVLFDRQGLIAGHYILRIMSGNYSESYKITIRD